ncbi:hypothetical protein [Cellulosimicrobium sp. CUA-896]|uniref:hypothetical protein n=1 Tax=Cellulosimicrobium sp. CUA-896 TaxID=1517881 RepID=UPI000B2CBF28|nr:hypothetical protein [Cellulosimicrobium sp. CUA-896]
MELQQIVERYAEAIEYVDATIAASGANTRTGVIYQVGFKSLNEEPAVDAIDDAWEQLHPGERKVHRMKVRYPDLPATAKVDHVITTDGDPGDDEWGIEVKRLQFVGDNGKRNDYATTKVLSPYLKDRGMLHDALRLREYGFTRRVAVVAYSFDYDSITLEQAAAEHTSRESVAVLSEIANVLDVNGGHMRTRPLMEFADAIMGLRGLINGPRAQAEFEAWRHPAGGKGVVFGWEIRRPQLEPDYDPRHPW